MLAHLISDLLRELRAGIVHRQDDRADLEPSIQSRTDELDVPKQLGQALEGVVLALDRDEEPVRSGESIHRQQPKRGWTVDQHDVVSIGDPFEAVAELRLSRHRGHELEFRAREVDGRGKEVQPRLIRLDDGVPCRTALDDDVVGGQTELSMVDPEPGRRVGLGIEVHQQASIASLRQARNEIHCRGGLADPTLLVRDGDSHACGSSPASLLPAVYARAHRPCADSVLGRPPPSPRSWPIARHPGQELPIP